jgi:hypothetical protein
MGSSQQGALAAKKTSHRAVLLKDNSFKIFVGVTLLWLMVSVRRPGPNYQTELTASIFHNLKPMQQEGASLIQASFKKPETAIRRYAPRAMDDMDIDFAPVKRNYHSNLDEIIKMLNGGPRRYMRFNDIISKAANTHGLDPDLIRAVIMVESAFHVNAESHKGARGLMQLMPQTAKEMGVTNIYNPSQNINGGTKYLKYLMKLFKNDTKLALAGYNAGPGAVKQYKGIPPYAETKDYVKKVMTSYRLLKKRGTRMAMADPLVFIE